MAGVLVGDGSAGICCDALFWSLTARMDEGVASCAREERSSETCAAVSGAPESGLFGVVGVWGTASVEACALVGDEGAGVPADGVEAADD